MVLKGVGLLEPEDEVSAPFRNVGNPIA